MCKAYELYTNKKFRIVGNFLAWYLALEGDYSVIDKLARARSEKDVLDAIYASLRVKDRLAKRFNEEQKLSPDVFKDKIIPSAFAIEEIMKYAQECPSIVGGVLAVLALSTNPYVPERGE